MEHNDPRVKGDPRYHPMSGRLLDHDPAPYDPPVPEGQEHPMVTDRKYVQAQVRNINKTKAPPSRPATHREHFENGTGEGRGGPPDVIYGAHDILNPPPAAIYAGTPRQNKRNSRKDARATKRANKKTARASKKLLGKAPPEVNLTP